MKRISGFLKYVSYSSLISGLLVLAVPAPSFAAITDSSNFSTISGKNVAPAPNSFPVYKSKTQAQGANKGALVRNYNTNLQCSGGGTIFTFQQNVSSSFSGQTPIIGVMYTDTHIGMPWPIPDIDFQILFGYVRGSLPTVIAKGVDSFFKKLVGGNDSAIVNAIKGAVNASGYYFYTDKMLVMPSTYDVICWYTQPQVQWR